MGSFFDVLFPTRCAFCRSLSADGLCARCERELPYLPLPFREEAAFGKCVSPLAYRGAVRTALLQFKVHARTRKAVGFGKLLAQCAAEQLGGEFDVVTWVPVSAKRRRERGYDQSYLLARETARHWDTEPVRLLEKTRHNTAQSALTSAAARRGNVLGVYRAVQPERIAGARILLIDDILTTGATMGECVRILKEAGARSVVCAALASTSDKPDEQAGITAAEKSHNTLANGRARRYNGGSIE